MCEFAAGGAEGIRLLRAGFAEAEPGGSSVRNYGGAIEADGLTHSQAPFCARRLRHVISQTESDVPPSPADILFKTQPLTIMLSLQAGPYALPQVIATQS